ncbi:MAG: SDR family NAD(P)-dependent oxidoreductase [Alphaproteobacteria bacterium]|nr:SDR family NAD(P)-dependent oxidoreductase [Alphaproteobacteria bacterium]
MLSPQGRVIMITGGNRGIGLAIARCLHGRGYSLSLGGRNQASLSKVAAGMAADRVMTHALDVTDKASAAAWIDATVKRFGRIDGLVNNAGISLDGTILDEDESIIDDQWNVNVKGPLRLTRLALPHLKKSGSGRVVNIASLGGKRVKNDNVGYSMSKFAVVALTHATRKLAWDSGVRATAVCPSFVYTDMTARHTDRVPAQNMTQPEDLAELVATVIALPNNASVAELLVNCRYEEMV